MPRIRRVESERELEKTLDEHITRGYEIEEQGQTSARVKENDWGSPTLHLFVFLFSLILGALLLDVVSQPTEGAWVIAVIANIVFAFYSHQTAEEIVFKVDGEEGA